MTALPILFKFLIAHFAGDFLLQPSRIVEKRRKSLFNLALVYHILIHLACILVVFLFDVDWLMVVVILTAHGLIDMLKAGAEIRLSRLVPEKTAGKHPGWNIWTFVVDQVLHLIVILVVWLVATGQSGVIDSFTVPDRWWLILLAYLVLTTPTGMLIGKLVRRWYEEILSGSEQATGTVTAGAGGLPKAGSWIGVIERVLTLSFILIGSFEAIGFLLAAKSILRIGDLKDDREHKKTEYILIGTLLSFGITIMTGLGLLLLLKEM